MSSIVSWTREWRSEMVRAGLLLLAIVVLVILAPLLAPADPKQTHPASQLQPPNRQHPLGTDYLGRDVLSRTLYGGQRTLLVSALATAIAVFPGLLLGLLAGSSRGWLDGVVITLLNALLAFPGLLLGMVVLTVLGAGPMQLALATGVSQIAPFAQVARSALIAVRNRPYVLAAQAIGATPQRIVLYHLLPNIQATLLAYVGVIFGYSILNSAALSFLGLGGEPGAPDWGVMLQEGRLVFRSAPWVGFTPGLAIALTVMSANSLADRVRGGGQSG